MLGGVWGGNARDDSAVQALLPCRLHRAMAAAAGHCCHMPPLQTHRVPSHNIDSHENLAARGILIGDQEINAPQGVWLVGYASALAWFYTCSSPWPI